MSEATARANGRRSKIRSRIEHVFAHQKSRMGMFVRTIGIARAIMKIGMVNLAYNISQICLAREKSGLSMRRRPPGGDELEKNSVISTNPHAQCARAQHSLR